MGNDSAEAGTCLWWTLAPVLLGDDGFFLLLQDKFNSPSLNNILEIVLGSTVTAPQLVQVILLKMRGLGSNMYWHNMCKSVLGGATAVLVPIMPNSGLGTLIFC